MKCFSLRLQRSATSILISLAIRGSPAFGSRMQITVKDVTDYFAGGHSVTVPREGYEDTFVIPKCEPDNTEMAISEAVRRGLVWLVNGPASILGEPVPDGILSPSATLLAPPKPIGVQELMESSIPDAWNDGKANALAIITALSAQRGRTLPWSTVQLAINSGIRTRWIQLSPDSTPWPCEFASAQHLILQVAETLRAADPKGGSYGPRRSRDGHRRGDPGSKRDSGLG